MYENEIYHHGVKGMKWGVRKARGHAGPGKYIGKKRQLAGYKRDLETLDKGGHLSVGITKKRQEMYDKRDRANLEKGIAKLENKQAKKAAQKAYDKIAKQTIKDLKKQYGQVEDQITYGKNADQKKNNEIQREMNRIENLMKKH